MRIAFASGEGSSPIVFFRDHAGARKIRASRTVRKYSNPSSGVRAIDTYILIYRSFYILHLGISGDIMISGIFDYSYSSQFRQPYTRERRTGMAPGQCG